MNTVLIVLSCALAVAWIPLALRFGRGWKSRRNPVSLAISAAVLFLAYANILSALALANLTTWHFFNVAWHVFGVIVVANFYVAFRWSDMKYPEARKSYSVPPTNTTSTPRRS
jgi:hypothetical protein